MRGETKSLRRSTPVASEPMSPHPKKPKRRPRLREIAKKAVDGLGFAVEKDHLGQGENPVAVRDRGEHVAGART
jgi:hypothetical protein